MDRKKTFIVLTVCLICFLSLFLAEVILRIYHASCHRDRFVWIPHFYLGYVHAPHNRFVFEYSENEKIRVSHYTNSLGLIGPEVSVPKPQGTFRILILGDSYTEALQVSEEKNFCGRLQTLLKEKSGSLYQNIEVLNAGVSGYSPILHYLSFKRALYRLQPDLVIVQLFGNDIFEDHEVAGKSLLDERGFPLKSNRYFIPKYFSRAEMLRKDFTERSRFYDFLQFFIDRSRLVEYIYVKTVNLSKNTPFNQKMIRLDEFATGYQFFILDPNNVLYQNVAFREKAWNDTQKYLLALRKLANQQGAGFFMFYVPLEAQLKLDAYGEHMQLYASQPLGAYFNGLLEDFSKENQVPFLDLLPTFEANKNQRLYFNRDGHLTEEGHELVSKTIFEYLKQKQLLP